MIASSWRKLSIVEAELRQLISKRAAAEAVGFHPEHLMRLSRAGLFPAAMKLGHGPNAAVRFVADEIEDWLARKMTERNLSVGT